MKLDRITSFLPQIKSASLPGKESHEKIMDLDIRKEIFKHANHQNPPRQSSVLCLLYPGEENQTKMVFILRKKTEGHHSGQIAFPGGKKEFFDPDDYHTALREAHEEVGIDPQKVHFIKKLSGIFIPVSNYSVQPFLAYTENRPFFSKQEEEVEKILELDLDDFLNLPPVELSKTYFNKNYKLYAFQTNEWLIWGATAMILSEIVDLLKKAGL